MKKMPKYRTVSEDVKIKMDGQEFLLEKGDKLVVNEASITIDLPKRDPLPNSYIIYKKVMINNKAMFEPMATSKSEEEAKTNLSELQNAHPNEKFFLMLNKGGDSLHPVPGQKFPEPADLE